MTTDYAGSTGCPGPKLERIARAGFTHVHWCHQWNTDFVYSQCEIEQIALWLSQYGLKLLDLHGSAGVEKNWTSPREYERQAGVELVANRLQMTARLGGDVVIMHLPAFPSESDQQEEAWARVFRSLSELEPTARRLGVRIAIENGNFDHIERVLERWPSDYVGLCYDCGHGNLRPDGLDRLRRLRHRLVSVHLHDNDGTADQHLVPFTGTVDWTRLAGTLADSSYDKCVSLEAVMRQSPVTDEEVYLQQAFAAAGRLAEMVEAARGDRF